MSQSWPTEFYAVFPDGFHKITWTDQYIGPQTTLLETLAKQVGKVLPNFLGDNTSLAVSGEFVAAARPIDRILLHTFFRPVTDAKEKVSLVPVWVGPGAEMKFTWNVPLDMRLFFILNWKAGGRSMEGVEPSGYLIARDNQGKTYLPPLPNLYDDGRICFGRGDHIKISGRPIMEQFKHALELFNNTKWNTDLLRQEQNGYDMFRYSPDGEQQAPARPWVKLCMQVNSSVYSFISKL